MIFHSDKKEKENAAAFIEKDKDKPPLLKTYFSNQAVN
jgi:hypothetical protein